MSIEEGKIDLKKTGETKELFVNQEDVVNKRYTKEWQKINFDKTLLEVCKKYPEFSEKIVRSLETPQLGEHHNEGPTMKSHLSLILMTLEEIKDGKFPESIQDANLKEIIQNITVKRDEDNPKKNIINPELIDYTFFHDIAKPDCLTLKIEEEKGGIEITNDQWKEIEKKGRPYRYNDKLITSISYFHSSEGSSGRHGNKAAEMLKDKGVAPEIIIAIKKHETAYQFSKINAATYEEHFTKSGFSENQQKFILVTSYIDTMATLG